MFSTISRPNREEDEEDLLRFQSDFLRKQKKPSANVIRVSGTSNGKIKEEREAAELLLQKEKERALAEAEEEVDKHDTHITKVLGDIVKEKRLFSPCQFPAKQTTAFPIAMKCRRTPATQNKKSIFAQEMERKKKTVKNKTEPSSNTCFGDNLVVREKNFKSEPPSKTEEKQGDDFQVTYNEMMEEIKSKLTPEQIEFLKKRGKAKKERDMKLNEEKMKSGASKPLAEENFLKDLVSLSNQELASATSILQNAHEDSSLPPETVQEIEGIKEKNYPNMGKLEEDKLEWIKNVESSSDIHEKIFHRFDFSGKLLSLEESKSLSSKLGMHHHGVQPDLAGYTLQDLFGWTRSQSQSQRNVALSTLSKIIEKDRRQEYEIDDEVSFVQSLLNAGFLFVLRLALDEKADVIVKTAVTCLKSLICPSPYEETVENEKFLFCDGCEMEPLQMTTSGELWKNDKTDHQVASKDLVHGLIKMNVIGRLRFLLEFANLDLTTTLNCIQIIERCCHHSLKAAVVVFEHSHLMEFFSKKLIISESSLAAGSNNSDDELAVLASSLAVFRRISQAGRHACKRVLLGFPSLIGLAFRVLAIATGEASATSKKLVERLKIEACKFLTVAVSYGHLAEEIRGRRALLDERFQQLHDCTIKKSRTEEEEQEQEEQLWESDVFFVRFFLCAIASDGKSLANVACSMVCALIERTSSCDELTEKKLLSVLMDFLPISSLCTDAAAAAVIDQDGEDQGRAARLMKDDDFITSKLLPLVSSLASICCCSSSMACGGGGGDAAPTYKSSRVDCLSDAALDRLPVGEAPRRGLIKCAVDCNLLTSLLSRLPALIRCCRNVVEEVSEWFGVLLSAVKWMEMDLIKMPALLHSPVSRLLLSTLDLGLKIISLGRTDDVRHRPALHSIALLLCTSLRRGQENALFQLLASKLFHPDLLRSSSPSQLDNQRLRSTYLPLLQPARTSLKNSLSRSMRDGTSIDTFHIHDSTGTLLPVDWPFVPILDLYNAVTVLQRKLLGFRELCYTAFGSILTICAVPSKPEETASLRNLLSSLRLIEFLEKERPFYMRKMRAAVKMSRLTCIFLAGDDLYANKELRPLLRSLYSIYCQNGAADLDFFSPIAGITSFYDFYESLLEHYEAVSMRDKLFSAVVLLSLHQSCDGNRKSKLSFWVGHKSTLSMHSITEKELLLPIECYLQPAEDDGELLQAYLDVLLDGSVNPTRSPALYKIAASHVAHFVNAETTSEAGKRMRELLIQHANDQLKTDVGLNAGC